MRNLTKYQQARLAARQHSSDAHPAPDAHPGPNILAAFAEQRLSPPERAAALAHLAACPDCREVLSFLSTPEPGPGMPAPPVSAPTPARHAFWWNLRWAAVALLACFATFIAWRMRDARTTPPPPPQFVISSGPSQAQARPRAFKLPPDAYRSVAKIPRRLMPTPPIQLPQTQLPQTQLPQTQPPETSLDQIALPNAPPLEAKAELTALNKSKPRENASVTLLPQSSAASVESVAPSSRVTRAFSGAIGGNLRAMAPAAPVRRAKAMAQPASSSLWRLSSAAGSEGEIQRSTDRGQTWTPVPVSAQDVFYALTSNGPDVWVGGGAGVLFHSTDDGAHWTRIEAPSPDAIVQIETSGNNQISLRTADNQTWLSQDSGAHWRRR